MKTVSDTLHCSKKPGGFTLVEAAASLALIAMILVGVLAAYERTVNSVARQVLRERGQAVAQRHMEMLLGSLQEPNSVNLPIQDEYDPQFTWQLDLQRITLDESSPEENLGNTVIQATVTVRSEAGPGEEALRVELVRYFSTYGLKPMPGHAVAVPITKEYEEPEWYKELRIKLGREPTIEETLRKLIETGDLPAELADQMDILKEAAEDEENIDPCEILRKLLPP